MSEQQWPAYIITNNSLTVYIDNTCKSLDREDKKFDRAVELIAKEEWDEVSLLLNPAKRLTEAFSDSSNVQLKHDHLYYKDRPLDNHLLERALAIVDEGLPDRKSVV